MMNDEQVPSPKQEGRAGCLYCLLSYPANWLALKFAMFIPGMPIDRETAGFMLLISPLGLPATLFVLVVFGLVKLFNFLGQHLF